MNKIDMSDIEFRANVYINFLFGLDIGEIIKVIIKCIKIKFNL